MNMELLFNVLEIENKEDLEEVKKKYKEFAKKYHPDISNEYEELFKEVTTLFNEYIKLHRNVYCSNNNNSNQSNSSKKNKLNPHSENKNLKNINLTLSFSIYEILLNNYIEVNINNKIYKFNTKEFEKNEGIIEKEFEEENQKIKIKLHYTIRYQNDTYIDNFGRIIKIIKIPFPMLILGGIVKIPIKNYYFNLKISENTSTEEILEVKSDKLNRPLFIKIKPLFPKKEELEEYEIELLKNLMNKSSSF